MNKQHKQIKTQNSAGQTSRPLAQPRRRIAPVHRSVTPRPNCSTVDPSCHLINGCRDAATTKTTTICCCCCCWRPYTTEELWADTIAQDSPADKHTAQVQLQKAISKEVGAKPNQVDQPGRQRHLGARDRAKKQQQKLRYYDHSGP